MIMTMAWTIIHNHPEEKSYLGKEMNTRTDARFIILPTHLFAPFDYGPDRKTRDRRLVSWNWLRLVWVYS